jgi:Flp pilus assembly protein CpaB
VSPDKGSQPELIKILKIEVEALDMKNRGGRFLLILGAGLAAMAFVVVYIVMSRSTVSTDQAADVPTSVQLTTVAVVKQDVQPYTMLDATNVGLMDVDATTLAANTTSDPTTLYGKMTLIALSNQQQVQTNLLTEAGFSSVLEQNERAFSLAVPEKSTFGNTVTPNDRIDVLWTVPIEYSKAVKQGEGAVVYEKAVYPSTKTLLQDVRVLRVISLRPPAPQTEEEKAAAENANPAPVSTLYDEGAPFQAVFILGLTDQQAEVLKFARESGVLDVTLRSSAVMKDAEGKEVKGDHAIEETTGITLDALIAEFGVQPPPAQP